MKEPDYCTSFPERILQYDISHCCKAHDDNYTVTTTVTRHEADTILMNCVKEAFPTNTFLGTAVSLLIFAGVVVFGRFFYKKQ